VISSKSNKRHLPVRFRDSFDQQSDDPAYTDKQSDLVFTNKQFDNDDVVQSVQQSDDRVYSNKQYDLVYTV